MKKCLLTFLLSFSILFTLAQNKLVAGPMLGDVQMISAKIWGQTSSAAQAYISYYPKDHPEKSASVAAQPDALFGNSVVWNLNDLTPATTYFYYFEGNKTQTYTFTTQALWQWRTDAPDFRVAIGSCTYINEEAYDRPGKAYGGEYKIFTSIKEQEPQVMLWMGDNIYLREPDWSSLGGIVRRYNHTRKTPELQALMSSCANYAIWDDHDFGPNDADGSFIHKDWTLDAFTHYWANPSYGLPQSKGITTQFQYSDVEFFLLDNRYHRVAADVKGQQSTILGEDQINWLIQALKFSRAPFKMIVVGGQFLNTIDKFETFSTVPAERERIIKAITDNNITGVVFLTGDRHCTELSQLTLENGQVIYDLTVSPLTSGPYDTSKEDNQLRVEGTTVAERNFATLDFSGPKDKRVLTITVRNSDGEKKWVREILQPAKK
ncbi:MAG: alkaline phosphatase D family protein [Flavobacteriales bacterium]